MKFLVLALCVCAASAASYGQYKPVNRPSFSPFNSAAKVGVAAAKVAASPFVAAAKVVTAPVAAQKYSPPAPAPVAPAPVAVAKTANNDAEAEVISNESEINADGSYNQHYEINNGISAESSGVLKKVGDKDTLVVTGSYKYYSPDGTPVYVTYTADENGYHAESDSLPVGPPVPKEIAEALEYLAKFAPLNPENNKY